MFRQPSSRNQRNKGWKVKHAFQIALLLAVSIWLLYQLKHSNQKRNSDQQTNLKLSQDSENEGIILVGRKEQPGSKHLTLDDDKAGEGINEQEGDTKPGENDTEDGGGGDDEIDKHNEEKELESLEKHFDDERENQSKRETYKGNESSEEHVHETQTHNENEGLEHGHVGDTWTKSMSNEDELQKSSELVINEGAENKSDTQKGVVEGNNGSTEQHPQERESHIETVVNGDESQKTSEELQNGEGENKSAAQTVVGEENGTPKEVVHDDAETQTENVGPKEDTLKEKETHNGSMGNDEASQKSSDQPHISEREDTNQAQIGDGKEAGSSDNPQAKESSNEEGKSEKSSDESYIKLTTDESPLQSNATEEAVLDQGTKTHDFSDENGVPRDGEEIGKLSFNDTSAQNQLVVLEQETMSSDMSQNVSSLSVPDNQNGTETMGNSSPDNETSGSGVPANNGTPEGDGAPSQLGNETSKIETLSHEIEISKSNRNADLEASGLVVAEEERDAPRNLDMQTQVENQGKSSE
ncbi:hypothetical protein AMTRI_Chr05g58000 [Amborella trichopoda]|uniref:Uncharacterized protein n=1 Tax=Amborella trichopoda TaxID=13333 RepID=U5CPN4_AMBTC|nr:dentin sialophosphoprotein [Amborella trichopoda]XP_020528782.1 dentin sialophosphoprotein [Amborella trichopoda]XP_020528783.1 dentin sialophosphoprotein [Amborella trichopoda]XP_020528785.1 dentin sialophosphoprotein [Amborella trichopoda]XP_020528786.1 dentin sialophosphoprotein [Amborella trichopoda]XP_020528787.1 dentin sialophosphoprotein [Amborella trichopoda]XP_020528788.1 dentin sialophosphoprotein [Amborella trichopoda]ERN15121.1 hypothetical protein AMTR_s00056p00096870 [Ambore|eukprot:XP_011626731.1 dentin sialophosphoprotein [Amborella trichopoda]